MTGSRRAPAPEFPDQHERLRKTKPYRAGAPTVRRYSAAFEALRDQPTPVPVFLATMGPIATHSVRAAFAGNLFASGGVGAASAGSTAEVTDVLVAYRGERVVCLAGSDPSYAAWGADLVVALRRAGAGYVVLTGAPSPDTDLADLVDDHCARGDDALAFLDRIRKELAR